MATATPIAVAPLRRRARRRLKRPLVRLAAAALPSAYAAWMSVVWRTSRIEDAGLGRLPALLEEHDGCVAFVFHENSLLAAWACRRFGIRPATLVSVSDAGDVAAGMLERCGFLVLRGGSSRGASRRRPFALRAMVRHERARPRGLCALAVDGSRGPRRSLKPGGLALARSLGRPIVLAHVGATPCLRLPSWDRLALPLPGSRIRLALRGPFAPPGAAATRADRERLRAALEREMVAMASESR